MNLESVRVQSYGAIGFLWTANPVERRDSVYSRTRSRLTSATPIPWNFSFQR